MTQASDTTGTYTFSYDDMNRLTHATTNYTFDTAGAYTVQYVWASVTRSQAVGVVVGDCVTLLFWLVEEMRLKVLSATAYNFKFEMSP